MRILPGFKFTPGPNDLINSTQKTNEPALYGLTVKSKRKPLCE